MNDYELDIDTLTMGLRLYDGIQISKLKNNFYVFTGSSVGVVPILGKGIYKGVIDKIGSVSTKIS